MPRRREETIQISAVVSKDVDYTLNMIAKQLGRSKADVIRIALMEYINHAVQQKPAVNKK